MNKKKRILVLMSATLSTAVLAIAIFAGRASSKNRFMTKANEPEYSVSLGNVSAAEASAGAFTRNSTGGASITFNTYGTVSALSNYVMNMPYGNDSMVYNVTPITGITSFTFRVANRANVKLMYGSSLDNLEYVTETFDDTILNQDITIDVVGAVNVSYFKLVHFKGTGAQLKSFTINYACAAKPNRGVEFNPENGFTQNVNYSASDVVTLDLKFTSASDTYLNIALLTDWSNGYGYFEIHANGNLGNYDGVYLYSLDDGYYRVIFDIAELTKIQSGSPTTVGILYIRGNWTTASGFVDVEPASKVVKTYAVESSFVAGTNFQYTVTGSKIPANSGMIFTVNFDPAVTEKKSFTIALLTDWQNMYGNFNVYNDGSVTGGMKGLKVGEHTYQFFIDNISAATAKTGSPTVVEIVYLRGANSQVGGTITIAAVI